MKDLGRWIHDIEIYPNFFCDTFLNINTEEVLYFEISEFQNDSESLRFFIKTRINYLISFNGVNYDDPHLALICEHKDRLNDRLYELTKRIIEENDYKFLNKYKWKFNKLGITQIDLFLYWSKMLRKSKMLSLKSLALQMNFHNVQELPIKPGTILTKEQMKLVSKYNMNDIEVTKMLFERMKPEINLRISAKKKYGFDCLSWDGVKLGLNILIKRYCDRTGENIKEVFERRTHVSSVNLSNIINDNISFIHDDDFYEIKTEKKNGKIVITHIFKSFNRLLKYLNSLTVYSTNGINCRVYYKGNAYDVKSGGLHTFHTDAVIQPKEDELYYDEDVGAYYPTFAGKWNAVPDHLGNELAEEVLEMKSERTELKKIGLGKSHDANLIKLSLNGGLYGNLNNEYTPMYDWKQTLKITVNGQLYLLMYCEMCEEAGIKVDMANTDGVTCLVPKDKLEIFNQIGLKFNNLSRTELEREEYVKVVRKNINNYLAVFVNGDIKKKGLFITKPELGNSCDFLIIPKALEAYFVRNENYENFIKNHDNIFDFCAGNKIAKSFTVYWNNEIQQQLNRYYVSKKGAYLYKRKGQGNFQNVLKDCPIVIYNQHIDKPMSEYNINYDYYISKVRKIINELEPKQLNLF